MCEVWCNETVVGREGGREIQRRKQKRVSLFLISAKLAKKQTEHGQSDMTRFSKKGIIKTSEI